MTPGRTAVETADTPEINAKNTATSLRERRSLFDPNIFSSFNKTGHEFSRSRAHCCDGLGLISGFDEMDLREAAICQNARGAG
jgi:hypothetical protein